MNAINRRQALTSISAIVAGSSIAAVTVQANNSDQHLVTLMAKVMRLEQECDIASNAYDRAYLSACSEYPKLHPFLKTRNCPYGLCIPRSQDEFDFELKTMKSMLPKSEHAKLEARQSSNMKAIADWRDACKAVDDKHRVDELDKMADDLFKERMDTELTILNTPAQTLTGLMVKLEIWAKANASDIESGRIYENGNEDIAPLAVLNDIKRLINQTT